jgi:hypothetical protein
MSLAATNSVSNTHTILRPKGNPQLNTDISIQLIVSNINKLGFKKKAIDIQTLINDEWTKIKGPQKHQFTGTVKLKFIIDIYTKLNLEPPENIKVLEFSKKPKIVIKKISKAIGKDLSERLSGLKFNKQVDWKSPHIRTYKNLDYQQIIYRIKETISADTEINDEIIKFPLVDPVKITKAYDVIKTIALQFALQEPSFTINDCKESAEKIIEELSLEIHETQKRHQEDYAIQERDKEATKKMFEITSLKPSKKRTSSKHLTSTNNEITSQETNRHKKARKEDTKI